MKLAIAVGIFVLACIPCGAHAQSQSETQPRIAASTPKPAESLKTSDEYKDTIEFLESSDSTTSVISATTKCATMIAKYNDLTRYVGGLKETDEILGAFGKGLAATSAILKLSTGNTAGAVADIQDGIQDMAVTSAGCLAFGPLCPVYKAGMTVGTIINHLPKLLYWDVNEQTISEVVGDYYAPMWGDLVNGNTVAQVEAGIEKMRADARKARASAQYAHNASQMCKKSEAKSAVQDILAKAKADAAATRMTPLDSGLSAQTDAAINAGRAGADSAVAAGNSAVMATAQTLQRDAIQRQQQAVQRQQQAAQARNAALQAAKKAASTTPSDPDDDCVITEGHVCTAN